MLPLLFVVDFDVQANLKKKKTKTVCFDILCSVAKKKILCLVDIHWICQSQAAGVSCTLKIIL